MATEDDDTNHTVSIYLWTCISHLDYRLHLLYLPLLLRTHIILACHFNNRCVDCLSWDGTYPNNF